MPLASAPQGVRDTELVSMWRSCYPLPGTTNMKRQYIKIRPKEKKIIILRKMLLYDKSTVLRSQECLIKTMKVSI